MTRQCHSKWSASSPLSAVQSSVILRQNPVLLLRDYFFSASSVNSVVRKSSFSLAVAFSASISFFIFALALGTPTLAGQNTAIRSLNSSPADTTASTANSDPLLVRAKSLTEQGRAAEAESLARQAIAKNPTSADAHFLLGYILFRKIQQHAGPESGTPDAAASNRIYSEKAIAGSEAAFNNSNARASLAEYTEGAKFRKPSAYDLKIVALDYILLSDYSDADKWLTKMLEWTPQDPEGWYYLGRTKYNENRFEESIHAFERCLQLDPKNVKGEDNLGLAYAGLGRTDEAISAYTTAMEWQKDAPDKNPGPFIDLASLLLDQNRPTDAISYLHQAIAIAPRDSKAHELLGKAYSRLEQFPQAQAELESAVALAPNNPNLPCMLGPVYRKRGLTEKAKLELDRCAALNGTHSSPEAPRP
jgi:Flp pilus assembly protein TadD